MSIRCLDGKNYSFVIVDDFFRHSWILYLRTKDEIHKIFLKLLQKRFKMKRVLWFQKLEMDHDGEFENKTFENLYEENSFEYNFLTFRTS